MGTSSFNDVYFEFVYLAFDQKYMSKMLIWEFKYKLMPHLLDWLNSKIELLTSISALAKHGLFIYKQISITN